MKDQLIQWHCASPDHRASPDNATDKLTINEGGWAFCPMDVRAGGHDWRRTGGLTLEGGAGRRPIVPRDARKLARRGSRAS